MVILKNYSNKESKIVQVNAMQSLVDFAIKDGSLIPSVQKIIQDKVETGSAAVKSRGIKLLHELS